MLAQQRRRFYLRRRIGQLDRIADREKLAALRMIHLNYGAGLAQPLFCGDLTHVEDRPARHIEFIELAHDFELVEAHRPFFDNREALVELGQALFRRRPFGVGDQLRPAAELHQRLPSGRLNNDVDVIIGSAALCPHCPSGLAAARCVPRARHRVAEYPVRILRIFHQRSRRKPLLITQLDSAKIEHGILHRAGDPLSLAGLFPVKKRGENPGDEMNAGSGIADLRARDQRRAIVEPGCARRAAGALGDVLIDFTVFVRTRAEALDRRVDQTRIDFVNHFPGKPLAVERARREVLHHHVTSLDQLAKNFFAFFMFGIDRDAAFVAVEHGEIETVDIRLITQLPAGDIAPPRQFDFDHVGAEPSQNLRAGRPGLHMRHIENTNSVERFTHRLLSP